MWKWSKQPSHSGAQGMLGGVFRRLRRDYVRHELVEASAALDPFTQFTDWFAAAARSCSGEVNAMALATVSSAGSPSNRMVLLKDFDREGFVFFTNYASRKGQELASHSAAAILFYWGELERQVRVEGVVEQVERTRSADYFHSRPREAQLSALVSEQSREVESRAKLEEALEAARREYAGQEIPLPEAWGGYLLRPKRFEFWQGRRGRLHDRLAYELEVGGGWRRYRLAP